MFLWDRLRNRTGASRLPKASAQLNATLRDMLIITYAVPPDKLAAQLPPGIVPDILPGADGIPVGFVQILHGFVHDLRPAKTMGGSGESFRYVALRILVRPAEKTTSSGSLFVQRQYIARTTSTGIFSALRAQTKATERARFTVHIMGSPTDPICTAFDLRIASGATDAPIHLVGRAPGENEAVVPSPYDRYSRLTEFLTGRETVYSSSPLLRRLSRNLQRLSPDTVFAPLVVTESRIPQWADLLPDTTEILPISALWAAETSVRITLPRLLRNIGGVEGKAKTADQTS